MPSYVVHVTAASRLHFGLIGLGNARPRVFGGVGVMVEPPNVHVRIEPSETFSVEGLHADRVLDCASTWLQYSGLPNRPNCKIVLESAPRMHIGLGVGTQLALSIARGLNAFCGLGEVEPQQLAASVGRGSRSAVGTHGFFLGGLLYEVGKKSNESLGPLAERVAIPEDWRFVLIAQCEGQGLSGDREHQAFGQLPEFPVELSERLRVEVEQRLIPAAARNDFVEFSDSVYRFGYQSGLGFAAIQGGAYNGKCLSHIVEQLRNRGVRGVGQSSWGPTLFTLCANQGEADSLLGWIHDQSWSNSCDVWIARPCNHGAVIWLN